MKKILITGGSGTVGKSFIRQYYDQYEFYNFSHSEYENYKLEEEFPNVNNIIGDITNINYLYNTFDKILPDVVIHAAALKHVHFNQQNVKESVETNVIGTSNIIKASIRAEIPLTIGISTDKSCSPSNTYGYTKKLMEEMFMETYTNKTKFICTRFANVIGSRGSVIPYWKHLIANGKKIKLTSPDMNRLMFSKKEAAELIKKSMDLSELETESFILSKQMKTVNMLDLAKILSSNNFEINGIRQGEKINEILIHESELPYTEVRGDYILIKNHICKPSDNLMNELSSETADRATKEQISEWIR